MGDRVYFPYLLVLFLCAPILQARIVHVPGDMATIQGGINVALDGDTVLVTDGTYTGDGNRDLDFTGKGITVMSENGPVLTIIDCDASGLDPHRGFYFHSGEDSSSVVQGFTIQNGYATGSWPGNSGGAIHCENSSPSIIGNTISENGTTWDGMGGGIYCNNSSPNIRDNTITNNDGGGYGGGIYCGNLSTPEIWNNLIRLNSIGYFSGGRGGGGIHCDSSSPTIAGNTISENRVWIVGVGGGISCRNNASPKIESNVITDNNVPDDGGGIHTSSSSPIIRNNRISGNQVGHLGGGIYCEDSSPIIANNTITDSDNAALSILRSSPIAANNSITGSSGAGIHINASTLTLMDSILRNNAPTSDTEIWLEGSSTLTIRYSDVEGGPSAVFVEGGGIVNQGPGNIDAEPLFVSHRGFDYLLRPGSPCIDAGDPAIEDGFDWPGGYPNGSRSDMGAYGGPGDVGWLR